MAGIDLWAERMLFVGPSTKNWEEIQGKFGITVMDNCIIIQPPNEPLDGIQRVIFNHEFRINGLAKRFIGTKCTECGWQYISLSTVLQDLGMGVLSEEGVVSTSCRRCWKYAPKQGEFHSVSEGDVCFN